MSKAATQVFTQASQDNNEAFDFPDGWVEINIGSVVDLNPGKPPADAVPHDAYVTFVPMPAVDAYSGKITAPKDRPFGAVRKGYTAFQEDDVIFAKITPCMENGKAAIARNLTNGLGFGSTEFHVLRSTRAVIPEYLYYYIRQESFRRNAEAEMTGSVGQRRVPVEFIKNSLLPLPPLAEQKRIVVKVEELLARVNTARERLAKVQEIQTRFRQSVLATACSGRLTADWREKYPDVEPASQLLRLIIEERKKCYKEKYAKAKAEGLKKPKKDYEFSIIKERSSIAGWAEAKLEDLIYIAGRIGWRGLKAEEYTTDGPLFLSVHGLNYGEEVDFRDAYHISMERYNESPEIQLQENDILLAKDGAGIGKIGIIKNLNQLATVNSSLLVIRSLEAFVPKYLFYFLSGPKLQNIAKARITGSATPHLFQKDIKEFALSIPPLLEQKEIVRRVQTLFKLADVIEKRVTAATLRAEKLTQAILAKAFLGELVPTEAELARREDRSYEPASALLAKIKAQRKDVKPQRKRGRELQRRNNISSLAS